ncbi:T5orf172 domain-containing protein [Ilyonectria robusta]|uniref:T5orf172 domain-containing protein n=1 Tax=Ilyonectria robusta TaxID=1079257 RepID=UPI001E8D70B1|nr:T5orf172 domain-containing protein [Ilyonectria robusta]KAH8683779.1 T5orf172 domain-containing protein [Ilyonectria robusta]
MSSSNDEKAEKAHMANNLSDFPEPQKSNSKFVPYPSPPNSPPQTKAPIPRAPRISGDRALPAGAVSSAPLSPPATSPRRSSALTVHQQPKEGEINAATLRTRLGLGNGRCGGMAKTGRPCGSWSPAANKAGVTSQLESMINLTQSSLELKAELDKLVMLVHCKNHDSGLPKKSRIEAWIMEFPIGEAGITNPATSVEKRIREALNLKSTQCIGVVGPDLGCLRGIGGQRVNNCAVTIDEIVNPDVYQDDVYLEGLLKVLETNMYCPLHINKQPLQMVASWKESILEILEEHLAKPAESSAPEQTGGPSGDSNAQGSESPSAKRSDGLVLGSGNLSIPNFDGDLSKYWPAAYDTSPFEIIVRSARLADYKSSYAMVKREMMRELGEKDRIKGHVYMYEVEGNKGFVKIGYTARTVEGRHREWDFDCNRATKALYPIPSTTSAEVLNVRRVEALCHAELNHRRIRIYCKACLKPHLEWFEISAAEGIAVIQKWSNWMETWPYKSTELRSGAKWTVREEERKRAQDMDRFLREI